MSSLAPVIVLIYVLFVLGVIVYLLTLLTRFVKAHEKISRHLLEIARDFKTFTSKKEDKE